MEEALGDSMSPHFMIEMRFLELKVNRRTFYCLRTTESSRTALHVQWGRFGEIVVVKIKLSHSCLTQRRV